MEEKRYPIFFESRKIPSGKSVCRSKYEEYFFSELHKDTSVIKFEVEPFKIPYKFGSKNKTYLPDILVTYRNGSKILVEIKTSQEVDFISNQTKFEAAHKYAEENGYKFEVWVTPSLAPSTYWSNVKGKFDYVTATNMVRKELEDREKRKIKVEEMNRKNNVQANIILVIIIILFFWFVLYDKF